MTKQKIAQAEPPLAQFVTIANYSPQIGDFVIWIGWFKTWYGMVTNINDLADSVTVFFESTPLLLLTSRPEEQLRRTYTVKINDIRKSSHKVSVSRHAHESNATIWFI